MRVLLTGVTGMLGVCVFQQMCAKGWEVIPVVRRSQGLKNEIIIDFDNEIDLNLFSALQPCQAIVHLASHIDFSPQTAEQDFYGTTIYATQVFIDLAKIWNAHFIFSSSISVYSDHQLIELDSEIKPKSAYAKTKWMAENMISSALTRFTILRYAGLMGLTQQRHLGINHFFMSALTKKLPPTVYGHGESKRNYIYVKDAASVIIQALINKIIGVFLIAGTEILSIKQMAEVICRVLLPQQEPTYEQKNITSADFIIATSKLFSPQFNFETMLQDIKQDYAALKKDEATI